jgi:hypothetical protein
MGLLKKNLTKNLELSPELEIECCDLIHGPTTELLKHNNLLHKL